MRTDRPASESPFYLRISIPRQELDLIENGEVVRTWPVSTAKNGPGERMGSGCTPRGWHRIRAKIGTGLPLNTVFVGRRPTGEIYDADLASRFPERDWILTRILWLGGLEPGFNRYGQVDTTWRYIYIHGSPEAGVTGAPASHGCIRMHSGDIAELFERVDVGTRVLIEP
ncbi:L,D-transpeptidase [Methylocaldum sp.]|uniref:L,D-transpeptidase n=1 Tax=Methylocaldum sp. TaxID=1969727 RepID=UPI002D30952F|nr:L,D-transpeptidase [Methylocaldum sp.]HYE38059.1 L,D-transpeptidase [Methylocaldum sp.]